MPSWCSLEPGYTVLFKDVFILFGVYWDAACVGMSAPCACLMPREAIEGQDMLELKLQNIASHCVGAGS